MCGVSYYAGRTRCNEKVVQHTIVATHPFHSQSIAHMTATNALERLGGPLPVSISANGEG